MATCGNCKATNQTISHIRACSGAATSSLPNPQPGNVLKLRNADGYWLVMGTDPLSVQQILAHGSEGSHAYVEAGDVEIVFPDMQSAADYRIDLAQAAERARVHAALHGAPRLERYYASAYETTGSLPADEPAKVSNQGEVALAPAGSVWAPVNELRRQIAPLLPRKIRNAMVGHYAVRMDGVVKFYRVKQVLGGHWDGKVFVEAQASDKLYPVKAPATLTEVLTAILADVQAAATLYGTELEQCYRCNRTLTDETSRAMGIGPECRSK